MQPRELHRERVGRYECVIFSAGIGRATGARIRPALIVRWSTGRGLFDWCEVHFSQAARPQTLRSRWARMKTLIEVGDA